MCHVRSLLRLCFHSLSGVILFALLPSLALSAERITQSTADGDALYVNGELVGYLHEAAGGYPARQITLTHSESDVKWATALQAASITWSPLEFGFAGGMLPGWYNWLTGQLDLGSSPTQQSSVTLLRTNGALRASQSSGLARLVEIEFPALDRAVVGTTRFRARLDFYGQPQIVLSSSESVPSAKPPAGPPSVIAPVASSSTRTHSHRSTRRNP